MTFNRYSSIFSA